MKKLEELFDLPPTTDEIDTAIPKLAENRVALAELDATIDKVEAALPQVRGLELADEEFDKLSKLAVDGYNDLTTLGMQVDSRFAAEIFSVASNMLGHAITAKTAKLDKKLKMIDLQLKKMRLDQTAKPDGDDGTGLVQTAQGVVLSRNDLLERIVGRKDQNVQKE
jgi:hypothetical protein